MNIVHLSGNLGQDPELKKVGDTDLAVFSLATQNRYKDKNGQTQKVTEWHNIEVWGKLAKMVDTHFKKGSGIIVTGRLTYNQWESNGEKKVKAVVKAHSINFPPSSGHVHKTENNTNALQHENPQNPQPDDLPF